MLQRDAIRKHSQPPNQRRIVRSPEAPSSDGTKSGRILLFLRRTWPYHAFVCLNLFGIAMFYLFESTCPQTLDIRVPSHEKCLINLGFSSFLFYTLSSTTTIGFGTVYPCSLMARIFGIAYCCIGIPVTLALLGRIGESVSLFVQFVYDRIPPRNLDSTDKPNSDSTKTSNDEEAIPVSVSICFILIGVSLAALYYNIVEYYAVGESIYYAFYTFVAGDLQLYNMRYCFIMFALVVLGFSMVATTYDIIQLNIQRIGTRVRRQMRFRQRQIITGAAKDSGKKPNEVLNEILKQAAPFWMRGLITTNQMTELERICSKLLTQTKALKLNSTGTQYTLKQPVKIQRTIAMQDTKKTKVASLQVMPKCATVCCQASVKEVANSGTQYSTNKQKSKNSSKTVRYSNKNVDTSDLYGFIRRSGCSRITSGSIAGCRGMHLSVFAAELPLKKRKLSI